MEQSEIEKIIKQVNGTMSMENMPLTDEEQERLRDCLKGNISYEDAVSELVKKYKQDDN